MSGRFRELQFFGEWRPYQRAALTAFEKHRANGSRCTHIVAPPGSGKTLLGVELIRRVGKRALVLAPNQGIQQQWPQAVGAFTPTPATIAGADVLKPIACLSYQALCELEDPEIVLGRLARSRWADERAAATGMTPAEALREAESFEGEDADQRVRELARISAALKREVARGEDARLELRELLSSTARARVQQLAKLGVGVVLLDECHQLASLWGYVIRSVLGELGPDVHVIGLTATPPVGLPEAESELYEALLGPVDFTVPTPAVVRDGHLAPYQELAWLTEPLSAEREWLAERDARFRELTASLSDDAAFRDWVTHATRERPKLARAGSRFLLSTGRAVPDGTPRGEAYRQPPALEDWLALLADYALRGLARDDSREAADRHAEISGALRELGFQLTGKGIVSGASEADRLLTGSQAKAAGLVEVLAAESDTRGGSLRALVVCDAELAPPRPDDALTGVLDPTAGSARHTLQAIAGDERTAAMRPLLVSGRGLRCVPADADVLLEALREAAVDRFALPEWEAEVDGLLVSLSSSGAEWMPQVWLELATALLMDGTTTVLVGTRALLGEGWSCRPLNVLVDLTVATAGVSVQQLRGSSLRIDRADPGKVASNWDIVCAAPALARGAADYERFVHRHQQLFGPAEDGAVEPGPSHVHVEMSPFTPPPAERFAALNGIQLARAADRTVARQRWRVGAPYRGVELPTLLVRRAHAPETAVPLVGSSARRRGAPNLSQAIPLGTGIGGALAFGALGVATGASFELIGLALAPAGLAWAAVRLHGAKQRLSPVLPLDTAARAVAEAYRELGELSPEAAGSITISPRTSGYVRCELAAATPAEARRFVVALEELCGAADAPSYLVSRPLADPRRGALGLLGRVLTRKAPFEERLHPVPADLARDEQRAETFARAWRRYVGPGRLIEAAPGARAAEGGYATLVRDVWV